MVGFTEDTALIIDACAYVIELYRELTEENGAPTPGTQNQAVNFILADPLLSRHVKAWGESRRVDEATAAPPQRLPFDGPTAVFAISWYRQWRCRFSSVKIATDRTTDLRYIARGSTGDWRSPRRINAEL